MRLRLLAAAAVCAVVTTGGLRPPLATAADIPAPREPIPQVIDRYIDAAIADAGVTPAEQADDATLVRRLTLDLVGRIPTTAEVDAFVKSTDADKPAEPVDRLIASPAFARHQGALFEVMFNPDGNNRNNGA